MKRPKAAPSLCWPKRPMDCAGATWQPYTRSLFPSAQHAHVRINVDGRTIRKAQPSRLQFIYRPRGLLSDEVRADVEEIARSGGTPLVVAENNRALGTIHLKDIVKGGMRERFAQLRAHGHPHIMITGDNPLTAAAIAARGRRG